MLFAKELMTLDDLSGGRFVLRVGAGGGCFAATVLGGDELTPGMRVARFGEFVEALDRLLTHHTTSYDGQWFRAVEARTVPGRVPQPWLLAAVGRFDRVLVGAFRDVGYDASSKTDEPVETIRDRAERAELMRFASNTLANGGGADAVGGEGPIARVQS